MDCEACGQAAPGARGRGGKGKAKDLHYCSTCGALAHAGCMQEQQDGALRCGLCLEGLQAIETVLGCRPCTRTEGRQEFYVKFKDRSYRRCRWLTQRAVERMAPQQLQRFWRDSRGALSVEPAVQDQWLQVERIVATRSDEASGRSQLLVKWRGLEYDKATWEPRQDLKAEKEAIKQFERRMALRVERDAAAEARARQQELAPLAAQPRFLKGVGQLKDYQLEGISWALGKLAKGVSAILGDEMGLGKTIQTAVFLQLARELGLTTGPVVVVVPLSTYGGWEREMAKWAPGLEVLSYSGHQEARALIRKYELGSEEDDMAAVRRKATSLAPRFHVMLTTYDVAIRDTAVLRRFDWSAMVIDEGHSLKGEGSKRGQQLRELGAPWRLLLTGTPLQNNLKELLVLLSFMADCNVAKIEARIKRMEDPNPPPEGAAGEGTDEELLQAQAYIRKLHAYLEPRMLRRMKAVCLAGQMPPKITRRVACRMTPLQRGLVFDILAKNFDKVNAMVTNRLEKKGMNNVLMLLRQTCNHPYMLPGQEPIQYKHPSSDEVAEEGWRLMVAASGKLSLLQQMLPRLLADGHRVLIFSQFQAMLDILEDFLHDFQDPTGLLPAAEQDSSRGPSRSGADGGEATERSGQEDDDDEEEEGHQEGEEDEEYTRGRSGSVIRYFRLDGDTKGWQRQRMMDAFNAEDCKVKVFLISTRAGSLGINLQTANTVILYDPDFNPFVDMQAEGRAHRLGQEETVLVYQLYTADSVEEKILELASKKRKLEELVTKHLGKARDISDDDIRSSVLTGWGNLMRQAEEAGEGEGKEAPDPLLSEDSLARLLDREHVFADDLATGADAAALLGEVRAGNAAAMTFKPSPSGSEEEGEGGGGGGDKGAKPKGPDAAMEAAMMRLLAERAKAYEQEQAARQEEMGRGRRSRGITQNYNEDEDGLAELLPDAQTAEKPAKGRGRKRAASPDRDYQPTPKAGKAGSSENAQPNAEGQQDGGGGDGSSSSSSSDDGSSSEEEEQPRKRQKKRRASAAAPAAAAAAAAAAGAAGAAPSPLTVQEVAAAAAAAAAQGMNRWAALAGVLPAGLAPAQVAEAVLAARDPARVAALQQMLDQAVQQTTAQRQQVQQLQQQLQTQQQQQQQQPKK